MLNNMLLVLILGCEIAFWLVLVLGLVARYAFRWEKIGLFFLYSIPLIDLLLLIVTIIDLRNGSEATFFHGLAAAYIGFSVAFGKQMIRWADEKFAFWFAKGPKPERAPSGGWGSIKYELRLWGMAVIACFITFILIRAMIVMVGEPDKTMIFYVWDNIIMGTALFWFIFGLIWSLLFHNK